jgi:Uncharacterized membrane protein (homolog of Drosophila rhomboid)
VSVSTEKSRPEWIQQPWVTWLCLAACVIVFIGIKVDDFAHPNEAVRRWGAPGSEAIWNGAWWGLITSAFVHLQPLHIFFNLYWLYLLGTRMEQVVGSFRYLAFVLLSAVVSSSAQLAFSESTGIGISGVLYAIFGFCLFARERHLVLREILTDSTIKTLLFWLVLCVVLTQLNLLNVANAAHVGGLVFGSAVAYGFALREKRWWAQAATVALIGLAAVPAVWMPWSSDWLAVRAHQAHTADRYTEAEMYYTKFLEKNPNSAQAYLGRGLARLAQNQNEAGEADLKRARELDPTIYKD